MIIVSQDDNKIDSCSSENKINEVDSCSKKTFTLQNVRVVVMVVIICVQAAEYDEFARCESHSDA